MTDQEKQQIVIEWLEARRAQVARRKLRCEKMYLYDLEDECMNELATIDEYLAELRGTWLADYTPYPADEEDCRRKLTHWAKLVEVTP